MRELMLRLLTYEPFEKISENEKAYINAVLAGDVTTSKNYPLYDDLMNSFKHFCSSNNDCSQLVSWFNNNYQITKVSNINVLTYKSSDVRAYYPVLFKKICFYCITEKNLEDAKFLAQFGISANILNKWEISPRYRKLINKNSHHTVKMYRNGKKLDYLTKVIKAAFYEASRQEAEIRFFNPTQKYWVAPKKTQLLKFIDVFSGTGTVAASVDANEIVVNDIDVGAVCFLYSMSHNEQEVKKRLAQLHNNFVNKNLGNRVDAYTKQNWNVHKKHYPQIGAGFDAFMILIRNNYQIIQDDYQRATTGGYKVDFSNPANVGTFYDIGVAWYFLNAIKPKSFTGNQFAVTDMDVESYADYVESSLGVRGFSKNGISHGNYSVLQNLHLTPSSIQFTSGSSFMKSMKNAEVLCEDFREVTQIHGDGFVYYDSPYFLTTDYNVPFRDEEHRQMLDLLRNADFKWLFSMQYKEFYQNKPKNGSNQRKEDQKAGQPLIKNYKNYYAGFANDFKIEYEKNLPFYVADSGVWSPKADDLYVILFYNDSYTGEMMIANFDARRVIPFGSEYSSLYANRDRKPQKGEDSEVVVIPFKEFMKLPFDENTKQHLSYGQLVNKARKIREQDIINNYHTGAWV